MTHDELLAKIDEELATNYADECGNFPLGLNALRAVVELHKPVEDYWKRGFTVCNACETNLWVVIYPCETIQVIEKVFS